MKKFVVLIAALLAALLIAGCASAPGPSASELAASAKGDAPAGTLIGQGTAKEGSKDASEKKAKDRALFALAKGMNSVAEKMVDDAVKAGKVNSGTDANELKSTMLAALSKSSLGGVQKVDGGIVGKDEAWVVYTLDKGEVLKEIQKAIDAAKDAKKAPRSFDTSDFDKEYAATDKDWR